MDIGISLLNQTTSPKARASSFRTWSDNLPIDRPNPTPVGLDYGIGRSSSRYVPFPKKTEEYLPMEDLSLDGVSWTTVFLFVLLAITILAVITTMSLSHQLTKLCISVMEKAKNKET